MISDFWENVNKNYIYYHLLFASYTVSVMRLTGDNTEINNNSKRLKLDTNVFTLVHNTKHFLGAFWGISVSCYTGSWWTPSWLTTGEREREVARAMGISGQGEEIAAPRQLLPGLPPLVSTGKHIQEWCSYKGKASMLLKMCGLDTQEPLKHC